MAAAPKKESGRVVLVSPDGKDEVDITDDPPVTETNYRFRGYLPKEQAKLEAPVVETPTVKTAGTNPS